MAENPDKFKVVALAAGSNVTLLADQVNNSNHVMELWIDLSCYLLPSSNLKLNNLRGII